MSLLTVDSQLKDFIQALIGQKITKCAFMVKARTQSSCETGWTDLNSVPMINAFFTVSLVLACWEKEDGNYLYNDLKHIISKKKTIKRTTKTIPKT